MDDDAGVLRALATLFGKDAGFVCIPTQDPIEAIGLAEEESPDVVLSDMRMPKMDGLALLTQLKAKCPASEVVLMTGFGTVQSAVAAVKAGAYDFLTKPFEDVSVVELAVRQAAEHKRLRFRNEQLEAALAARDGFEGLVGSSPEMQKVYKLIETVAHSDATILIQGESGTGKELVARSLHTLSPRSARAFVAVNCAAFPETLIEAELFGHERGAFTGAVKKRDGRFKAADGGTLLLDEIS
ncbi:MAG TPA: sigma 54-interacting transcriptional regulator, partial [Anaeromyxobacteraceae bacterium]|nr:sigma 54-interacting transcriptional regulator [Anaeromyxobacteraceae bacterium]